MEKPDAGVVRDDAKPGGVARGHLDRVSPDGIRLALDHGWVERLVRGRVVFRTANDLEFMAVQVTILARSANGKDL